MEKKITPVIADVILKVKAQQELTPQEELIYLIHVEGLPEAEATKLIDEWYGQYKTHLKLVV